MTFAEALRDSLREMCHAETTADVDAAAGLLIDYREQLDERRADLSHIDEPIVMGA